MATVVVKTIGNGTRDYTSIGAWEDACPSNLVTSDQIWKGELYPEGSGTNGQWDVTATPINVGGITSDADHYLWLTTASGQSWYDNANKLTNAFKYNNANGVAIQIAGNYTCLVEGTNTGLRFTGLQIRSAADFSGLNIARQPARFERCIIEWRKGSPAFRFGQTLINCLVWIRESGGSVCNGTTVESGNYRNTTFIGPGSGTAFTTLQYSSNNVIRNCAVFNFSSVIGNSAHWTGADCVNNATDLSSFGIGSSNQTSLTYSAQFTNTTSGSEDFRAVESGSLDGNGVRDQTFTDDLDAPGQTRSTSAPTIGAWEVVAAAAPDPLETTTDDEQQAAVAQVLAAQHLATQIAGLNCCIPISNRADVLGTDAAISAKQGADPAETARTVLAVVRVAVDDNQPYWNPEDPATGDTTLVQDARFDNAQTFYTHTLAPGEVVLDAARFDNAQTFFGPSVGHGLLAARFDNVQAFFSHTLAVGAVNLSPARFDNAQAFYAPTVTQTGAGVQDLQPARFDNAQSFFSHTLTVGAVNLSPARFDNAQAFFTASLALNLAPARFDNAQAFFSHTLTVGAVNLAPARFDNAQAFFAPTVSTGAINLAPARFDNAQAFFAPTVGRGPVNLAPARFDNAQAFYAPTVTQAAGGAQALVQAARFNNGQRWFVHLALLEGYPNPADVTEGVVYGPAGVYTGTRRAGTGQVWLRRR